MPNNNNLQKKRGRRIPFYSLSIQQRLPLLICILLLCTVIILSWTSYLGVKKASIEIGKQRLRSLTGQLSNMFAQSAQGFITATHNTAHQDSIKNFLLSDGKQFSSEATEALRKLHKDTSSLLVELLNKDIQVVLQSGKAGIHAPVKSLDVLFDTPVETDSCRIGKLYHKKDSVYYPVIAAITNNQQTIGYIIRWRLLLSNSKSITQLSGLMGTNASFYIGNADGSLWTDMIKPVQTPPLDSASNNIFFDYSRPGAQRVIATSMPIGNTKWLLLVEFSKQKMTAAANHFLKWIIIISGIIILIGSFIAWQMSRKITRPLNQLTAAATAIASGDYSSTVEVGRRDELGKLARAFNAMATKVSNAQHNLEDKVQERTMQLENANKELEAFSYSVSHDLRAPLRAISGYAMILKEDHQENLDPEAKRMLNAVISNSVRMGQLIDDLLAFSKMGKKELMPHAIDMKRLAQSCVDDLAKNDTRYNIQIENLPSIPGDQALLKQVWMNLLSNAIKYSSKTNTPRIEIGYKEDQNNFVYFIRDNGVGFDMKYSHKLFGIFQRLHDQEAFEGTGIGLALVKRIINKHGGDIWAESILDKGATFYFSLPKNILHEL